MRKVKPQDEIPVIDLSETAIQHRLARYQTTPRHPITNFCIDDLKRDVVTRRLFQMSDMRILSKLVQAADVLLTNEISPHAICRLGCSHCCKVPVHVTSVEAKWIEKETGHKRNRLKRSTALESNNVDYCPFHDEKSASCSIYEHRPLACRLYATFDHYEFCTDPNQIHMVSTLVGTQPFDIIVQFLVGRGLELEKKGKGAASADIRDWFA